MLTDNTANIVQLLNTTCQATDFSGVSIDSRDCKGALFIAIIGEHLDGHDFIGDAIRSGAVAVVVSKACEYGVPAILVEDTTKALGIIAQYHLQKINPTTIAITGSNGKTTTKNMLRNIFSQVAPTLATRGNFNNHIGVPLTLLRLQPIHKFAIIEMGANHLGEIAYLRNLVNPDVACVLNTLDAHIGEFGGKENLIKAKGEIYSNNSINIVNTATNFSGSASFGKGGNVDYDALENITLQLLGEHNKENALAAIAIAKILHIDGETIKVGLEKTQAEPGRLEVINTKDNVIINDCYNASPSSARYALKTLSEREGVRVAVLGIMGELGDKSSEMHAKVGEYAKSLDIDYLYSIGEQESVLRYGCTHIQGIESLLQQLQQHKSATILFKASRSAKLERVIEKLTQ